MVKLNKNQRKNLGLFFTFGVSLEDWFNNGSAFREINYYNALGKNFNKIYWFTYGINDQKFQRELPEKIVICQKKINLPNPLYSILLPFLYYKKLKTTSYLKTNQIWGSWTALIAKLLFRKPLLLRSGYTLSLSYPENHKTNLKKLIHGAIEKLAYSYFDKAAVTSQKQKKHLTKIYKLKAQKISVLHNPINTKIFKPGKSKIKQDKKLKLLYVGRLSKEKNLLSLLKAIKEIKNIDLTIIGRGKFKRHLETYSKKHKLPITFIKKVDNKKLPLCYNNADIYIQTSFYEGCPKTILEAMSCGLACLGTDVRGINEVIKHNYNGWLVKTNHKSIKQGIIKLMNDEKLRKRLGKNARQTIEEKYSLEKILGQEIKIYDKLLK